ncbi:MAG: type II secretion system minor pseudopilin GspK [Thermodesulfovibrionales bacterium]
MRIKNILLNEQGIALVLTLMVLVLITALVVEFAYGVHTGTDNLYNWYDSQRLSVFAVSGINLAANFISDETARKAYTYPGFFETGFDSIAMGLDTKADLRIEDESAKLNVNAIVDSFGNKTETFISLKRLLVRLSVDESIADKIADWIDSDAEESSRGSEIKTKNAPLYSIDELLLIKGIDKASYEKLRPYVTVYGDGLININTAEKPVLASLSESITDKLAQKIIDYRINQPFEQKDQLQRISGFELGVYGPLISRITVKGTFFYVRTSVASRGIRRTIEAVIGADKNIKYWRES